MPTARMTGGALAVALAMAAAVGLPAPTASAQRPGESSITARVDNPTPAVGEQFVVRGNYVFEGLPAAGHDVVVQTYRHRRWVNLDGARVTAQATATTRAGHLVHPRRARSAGGRRRGSA